MMIRAATFILIALVVSTSVIMLFCLSSGMAGAAEEHFSKGVPEVFKVFSKDGVCHPKDMAQQRRPTTEVACRFTDVRFQIPASTDFPASIEDAIKTVPAYAEAYRKDPGKARAEWDKTMRALDVDFCSPAQSEKLKLRIKGLDANSKRKQLLTEMIQTCSNKKNPPRVMETLAEIERSTCEVWVDHFSLGFRKIDERKWLYTQDKPSYAGNLKIYELTAEPEHDLWTLTETRMVVGQKEQAESQSVTERKTWSWQSWDSFEIPERCHFISHRMVQYE